MLTVHPTLYVSGPVTGIRDDNQPAFEAAARQLRAAGYKVRIPHDDVEPGTPWVAAMRTTLMAILAQADGLAVIDGWGGSRGAMVEVQLARAIDMPVATVGEWLHAAESGKTSDCANF